jgi:hypothetical protein
MAVYTIYAGRGETAYGVELPEPRWSYRTIYMDMLDSFSELC